MKRFALFGAGTLCPMVFDLLGACPHLGQLPNPASGAVSLFDDNPALWGTEKYGLTVQPTAELDAAAYDKIIICSLNAAEIIADRLTQTFGIPKAKLDLRFSEMIHYMRKRFVIDFAANAANLQLEGDVAEGGVFQGAFAAVLSRCFPDRNLWLFDTFDNPSIGAAIGAVRARLPHPDRALFRQGLFPGSATGDASLCGRTFLFVNLDFNLYTPTLDGLRFFYPKLTRGGAILVHDTLTSPDVARAVQTFRREANTLPMPIGDGFSAAIIKL